MIYIFKPKLLWFEEYYSFNKIINLLLFLYFSLSTSNSQLDFLRNIIISYFNQYFILQIPEAVKGIIASSLYLFNQNYQIDSQYVFQK